MPNLMERHKMKKQQFFGTPSQIYNIYYTDSLPSAQLPSIAQNLTKSFAQLSLAPSNSVLRTKKNPKSSGLFRRNRCTPKEKGLNESLPYFPEEYQRQQIANLAMNQLKIRLPEFRENQNCESQSPQIQTPTVQYRKNAITNYSRSINSANSSQEQYEQCQLGYQNDLQRIGIDRKSPQGSPTSVTSSLDSCNRGMVNNSGQIITVPTQPMSSNQGYSMKIEVLAQPLKTEVTSSDKLKEDSRDECEASEFTRRKCGFVPQNILQSDRHSQWAVPVWTVPIQSIKSIPITCTKKKKKKKNFFSICSKIVLKMRRENSAQPAGIDICETPQIYSGGNSKSEASAEAVKVPLLSITGLQNRDGYSATSSSVRNVKTNTINGGQKTRRNEAYVAQEILSPRQMISSTTNICSAKTEVQSTDPANSATKTINYVEKKVNFPGEEIENVVSNFQDVIARLEDTLAKHCFKSDAERKIFTQVITNKLKEHGFELNIHDQFVVEMTKKERKDHVSRNNVIPIEELSNTEPAETKGEEPPHIKVSEKHWNQIVPEPNMTPTSRNLRYIETMDRFENQILPDSPNPNAKSSTSSASYICGDCRCKNSISISGQDEGRTSLSKEAAKKHVPTPKEADDDLYNWKALYGHDVIQNSYSMFETNPANMVTAREDEHIKYQRWLKIQNRDRHLRSQECVDGGPSSRTFKSIENLANFRFGGSLSHRHREREHSPPERDLFSRSVHANNRGLCVSGNPSVSGCDHMYLDSDPESWRFLPNSNSACCGLVMYGQTGSAISLTQGQCCHRAIPVCGTVSRGVSPRYEPNLMMPTYHDRDANHHIVKTQCRGYIHKTDEKKRRHRHYHISKLEGDEEKDKEDSEVRPEGLTESVVSATPMLRNLANAANTILTTIFGRSTDRPQNQGEQFQSHNREPRTQHPVVISSSRRRATNDAIRRQHREGKGSKGHAVFNPQHN